MATEKILNTRILMKVDTLENWSNSTLPIKKGELCFATVAANAGNGLTEPVVMVKIGEDGIKTFKDLSWNFYAKASDVVAACKDEAALKAFINGIITDAGVATDDALKTLSTQVTTNKDNIATLNGDASTEGSVAKAIKDAIDALNLANTYDAKGDADQALADAKAYADGLDKVMGGRVADLEAKFTGDDSVADQIADAVAAEAKLREDADADLQEAIDAINNAETGILKQAKDHADGKNAAIEAAQKAGDDAMAEAQKKVASVTAADASVTVGGTATAPTVAAKLSADADNALTLADDGLKVVIPAAAEYSIVKAADSGDYAAVYNLTKDGTIVGASINIPKDMVVKSGSVVGDEIVLVLNDEAATEIKIPVASLIEYVTSGSATGDMVVVNVSDDHKVTATITDGTITLAKLTTDVQTAIGKAHSHENATVLDGINADKVAAWDAAEANAIAKANELNGAMNTRVEALEAIDHDHANKAELDLIASGDKAKWDAAAAKAHEHANKAELDKIAEGDKAAWDAKVEAVTAAADSGIKATRTGNAVAIEIDDSITFVFDCGGAGVTAAE